MSDRRSILRASLKDRRLQASVTMLRLKPRRRAVLVETFRELANLSAGAFVLGQFVGPQPPSAWLILVGAAIWIALVGLAFLLAGDEQW